SGRASRRTSRSGGPAVRGERSGRASRRTSRGGSPAVRCERFARGPPMIPRRLGALTALALLLLAGRAIAQDVECPRWREAFAGMPLKMVTVQIGARTVALRVRTADTPDRQAGGFQCATPEEIHRSLLLFDFGNEIITQFHMKNVPAPLDIAFIKADGRIFSILRMEPSPTQLYGPMGPFRYALEARAGFYQSQGIRQGEARLVISDSR